MVKSPVKSWSPIVCTCGTAAKFVEETYEITDFVGSPGGEWRGPRELSSQWTRFQAPVEDEIDGIADPAEP